MYYKLQVNSVFGKMLQKNEDHLEIKFITEWTDETKNPNKKKLNAQLLIASSRFKSVSIFNGLYSSIFVLFCSKRKTMKQFIELFSKNLIVNDMTIMQYFNYFNRISK